MPFRQSALAVILTLGFLSQSLQAEENPVPDTDTTEQTAQAAEPSQAEILYQEAAAIENDIRITIEKLRLLELDVNRASGENRQALRLQAQRMALAVLDEIGNLLRVLRKQLDAGIDTTETRDSAVSYVVRASNALDRLLDEELSAYEALREQRDSLSGYDLVAFESTTADKLEWIEVLFNKKQEAVFALEALGINTDNHQQNLVNRVTPFAQTLAGQLRLIQRELENINITGGDAPLSAELRTQLRALRTRQTATLNSLSAMVRLLDDNDIDSTEYRKLLLQSGEVNPDIFNPRIMLELIREDLRNFFNYASKNAGRVLTKAILFLAIILVFRLFSAIIMRIMRHSFETRRVETSRLVQEMLLSTTSNGIMIIGFLIALGQMGVQITALLAGLGIAGFIVGFALQDSLANFAAGVMILAYRPYDVDDIIETGDVIGKVSRMSLVSTTILTFDNQTLIIPNNKIWGDVIRNITYQTERRIDMEFSIAYDQDVDRVKELITDVVNAHDAVLDEPLPTIQMDKVTPYAAVFVVRPWVKREDYWPTRWALLRAIKGALDDAGIMPPKVNPVVTTPG